jgi:O-antigen ligase
MFKNIKKIKLDQNQMIRILFNIYPFVMLFPSGFITTYVAFFIIYSYVFILTNKIKIKFFFTDFLIHLFFILSIISTIINYGNTNYIIVAKSIADIRFALLFLLIRNLFYYKIIKIDILLISSLICATFLSLDIFLQFGYGKDILGYPEINVRYGGVFGEEAIAGSYIQKFSILGILASIFLKFSKIIKKKLFIIFITTILGAGILLTLDRTPFIIYLLSLVLMLISVKNFRKIFFSSFIIIILFFLIIYKNNDLIKQRYSPIYGIAKNIVSEKIIYIKDNNKQKKEFQETAMNSGIEYFKLFNSAIYVFNNHFWFGSGSKSFLKSCVELIKYNKDLLCSTHPHNIYLEILINQGIIGMVIFITFLFILLRKYYLDLIIVKTPNVDYKLLKLFFLIILIVELWPLRSYGSIFQTVNGTLFWFLISLASSNLLTKKN